MYIAQATYETSNGSRYLQQLCKHFAHKVDVTYDTHMGRCALPSGPARMQADDRGISFHLTAQAASEIVTAKYVIDSHLVTFAHRESFTGLDWAVIESADQEPA